MKETLKQTIYMYVNYLNDECFSDEDKQFFVEQILACANKLKSL